MNSHASVETITCALCIGAAPEPYLPATLASIADAVDVLVVNDNSGAEGSESLRAIEASRFACEGRLRVGRHPFVDFAAMRNDAQGMLLALDPPPTWVLFIDADEVHGAQLLHLARSVLPRLGPDVAQLDAYTFHFWGTFGWISDIARRMVFYRFSPNLRWENPVHEKLRGLSGRAVVVPYIYHHYGNVLSPYALAQKHQRYYTLGNPVPEPPQPEAATLALYVSRAHDLRPYQGTHPAAACETVAAIRRENAAQFDAIDEAVRARRTPLSRARTALAGANEALRVRLRKVQHPLLYRAPTVAR